MIRTDDPSEIRAVSALHLAASGQQREQREEVAVEEPFELKLGGTTLAITMRTPGHDEELTAGFLLAEGHDPRGGESATPIVRRGTLSSAACGVCGRDQIEDLLARLAPITSHSIFQPAVLTRVMQELQRHQPIFVRTGGLHAAALVTREGQFLVTREDVGRHNAVDKVIGRAALEGWLPLASHALIVSGRTSFEILQKAVTAGVPAVVAISAPSSLAIELAERFGVLLVGFARGGALTVYAGRHRLEGCA